jgi:4-hydroxybenzoyl-CoA thioesterase
MGRLRPGGHRLLPRYFVCFDIATVALFAAAGLPRHEMVATQGIVGIPMVDTGARFMIPSRWGETITMESYVVEWRRSSFDIRHRVLKGEEPAIEAWETRARVGRDAGAPGGIKGRPIPDEGKARFA